MKIILPYSDINIAVRQYLERQGYIKPTDNVVIQLKYHSAYEPVNSDISTGSSNVTISAVIAKK